MNLEDYNYIVTDNGTSYIGQYQDQWSSGQQWDTVSGHDQAAQAAFTEDKLREMMKTCVVCTSDCEWVLCDVCKLAVVELRDKVLEAIAKTIEEDLS